MPTSSLPPASPLTGETLELSLELSRSGCRRSRLSLAEELKDFCRLGQKTRMTNTSYRGPQNEAREAPTFVNEFWTAKQRQAHSLHEISYRACFKPQLPRFFIERLTQPGEVVYDPFMGRGTTLLEAALNGRVPFGCDINPLSGILIRPRLRPPTVDQVAERLKQIEQLGTYQPLKKGDNFTLDLDRAKYWLSKGAQPSDTVASFIKKASKAAAAVALAPAVAT